MNKIPEISIFNGSVSQTTPTEKMTITQFLDNIKAGYWKSPTERIREADPESRRDLKTKILPSATMSGLFHERKDSALIEYSGYLALDLDHHEEDFDEVWTKVCNDPFTYAAFRSVSGSGICVIVQTSNPESHADHFRWCDEHYKKNLDVYIDTHCRNISRCRFVSYDPNLYTNLNAKPAGKTRKPKEQPQKLIAPPVTNSQIERIVSEIGANGINLAESYEDYFSVAMALATEFGEGGRYYFHTIASISDKYNQKEADRKYNNALQTGSGSITIATLLKLAKDAGIELYTHEERQAFQLAKAGVRAKSDVDSVIKAAEQSGVSVQIAQEVAEKVFDTPEGVTDEESNSIVSEIASFISFNCALEYNTITNKIENDRKPIDQRFANSIYLRAKQAIGDKVTKTDVNAIIESDAIPDYCPIQRWIENHQHLPHKPEVIEQLLDTIPYKIPEARDFIKHWLLGIPATYAGEIVRLVLVLCGDQQTGKTYWYRNLIPEGLKDYYAENGLNNDYESAMVMSSNIIVMDDEYGGKSKKDAQKFKEYTSKANFDLVMKYDKLSTKMKRLAMLCGTSNETEFLNDTTGNTRILPVEFHTKYNFELYNSIDKDQLFIELFRAHERGESWQLSEKAANTLKSLSQSHSIANEAQELVDLYLTEAPHQDQFMKSTTEIKASLFKLSNIRLAANKLGEVLKKDFGCHIKKVNGKTKRGYYVKWKNELHSSVNNDEAPF